MARQRSTVLVNPKVKEPKPIVIEDIVLGGISDSPYIGQKNSVSSLVGFDVDSVPGLMLVAQKMTQEQGGSPNDDYYKILACSDGNIYLFGKTNGKVYKNTSGLGSYTLLGTVSPSSGSAGILDAIEFNSKIYYMMQNYVGEWTFASAFSTRNDSKFAFSNGNASYHPTKIVNNVLYIGDGNNVAQIDTTDTFTGAVFQSNFQYGQVVSALGVQTTNLLIGTAIPNNVPNCHVYLWNTWGVSYTNDYLIPEVGVNCFIQAADTDVAIQAGLNGNIYRLNGANTSIFTLEKQIAPAFPTIYDSTHQAISYYAATAVLKGIPLFAMSNSIGNPCLQGIYSYGHRASNFPIILNLPYPISTGGLSGLTIWSLAVSGLTLYASSFDGTTYRIDKLDYTLKCQNAFFETILLSSSKIWLDLYEKLVVNYQSLPSGTNIYVYYDTNWSGYVQYTNNDIFNDTDRNEIIANLQPRAKTIRFKISPIPFANTAPIIENVIIQPN